MTKKRQKFDLGIRVKPTDEALEAEGEISVSITDPKLKARLDGADRNVVTEDQTQELTNKTIDATDATGTNTVTLDAHDATYDDTLTTTNPVGGTPLKSLGDDVQSALDAVKVALDDQNDADEISYDPTLNPETTANNVQAALDDTGIASAAAQQTADNHIANPTGAHAASAIANTPLGNLAATDVQGALNELQDEMDDARQDLVDHEQQVTDAHDASAISHTAITNLSSNNVQDALQELQEDIDTRATGTSLTDHTGAATGAHAASAISVTPTGNLAADDVQEALEELQADIDGAVNSSQLTAHTTATSAHGTTSAIVGVDDVQTLTNKTMESALEYSSTTKSASKADIQPDPTTTGSDATLFYTNILASHLPIMRLENGSLVSVAMLANPEQGKEVTIINATGNDITIRNDVGATAANRILTGTKADIVLKDEASIVVKYDSYENASEGRWMVIGGVGAEGGGDTDVDVMFVDNFERTTIADYTTTGIVSITESASEVINGTKSLKLDHDLGASSAKRIIDVPNKFRGKAIVIEFDVNSNATSGNITGTIVDETNVITLVNAESIEPYNGTGSEKRRVYLEIPETCASLSYEVDALAEASAVTIIDDIQIKKVFQTTTTTTTDELLKENVLSADISRTGTILNQIDGFIQSVTKTGPGTYDIVLTPGYFTIKPSISISPYDNVDASGAYGHRLENYTASGFTLKLYGSTAVLYDDDFTLTAVRANGDRYDNLIRRIETKDTFSEIVVLEDRDISEINEFSGKIDTVANGLTILDGHNFIDSVTGTTADRRVNFKAGVFSATPTINVYYVGSGAGVGLHEVWNLDETGFNTRGVTSNNVTLVDLPIHVTANRDESEVYNKTLKRIKTNPNQKIKIPSSEMRLEDSNGGRGTGSETGIIKLDTLVKSTGSHLLLDNSNGTKITVKKDGIININAKVFFTSAGTCFITKNQTTLTVGSPPIDEVLAQDGGSASSNSSGMNFSGKVKAGDVIRVSTSSTSISNAILDVYFYEDEIQVGVSNILPKFSESDACIDLYGFQGYGTDASNNVVRFSTQDIFNPNGKVAYTSDAPTGDKFEILEDGTYTVSAWFTANTINSSGITLNSSSLTTPVQDLPDAEQLTLDTMGQANNAYGAAGSVTRFFTKGDIIRFQTGGPSVLPTKCRFTISQVGKPNVTGVDITPFVTDYPMLKMENVSSVGTADITSDPFYSNGSSEDKDNTGTLISNNAGEITSLKNNIKIDANASYYSDSGTTQVVAEVDRGNGYFEVARTNTSNSTFSEDIGWNGILNKGDKFKFRRVTGAAGFTSISIVAVQANPEIVTATDSNLTDWTEYTPAVNGFGTVTNLKAHYELVGHTLNIRGSFQAGTVAASLASVSLPDIFTYNTDIHANTGGNDQVGVYGRINTTTNSHGGVTLINVANGQIEFSSSGVFGSFSTNSLTSANGNAVIASSETIYFDAKIPINEAPKGVKQLIKINKVKSVETPPLVINTTYTLPHGLGEVPDDFRVTLVFVNAAGGYSVGDEVVRWIDGWTGVSDSQISVTMDANNFYIRSNNTSFGLQNKTTGAATGFAIGDVKVKVRYK